MKSMPVDFVYASTVNVVNFTGNQSTEITLQWIAYGIRFRCQLYRCVYRFMTAKHQNTLNTHGETKINRMKMSNP